MPCRCIVTYATALLRQAQQANTNALYVLAATFDLYQESWVATDGIVGKALALRRLAEAVN